MAHLFQEAGVKAREKPKGYGPAQSNGGFGAILEKAAQSVLADARKALTDPGPTDPQAVHALRKAFKRWRALMRLLRPAVGEPADAMRHGARELMRQLSGARDGQAALDALDDLAKGDVHLSPRSLATLRARMTALRDEAGQAAFTPDLRERVGAFLSQAERDIGDWGLAGIPFTTIADSLTGAYRRARRLRPENWQTAAPDELHALRRRVVEHRHQMELIEPLRPRLGKARAEDVQRLRNRLGACQDLSVLERFLAPHQPLARWRLRLTGPIAARRAEHLRAARRLAGRLFADKPNAFRKRIGASWDALKRAELIKRRAR